MRGGFGDDQVGRAEYWVREHPGWQLFWPPFRAPLGSEFEVFRMVHVATNTSYKNVILQDLLDEMCGRCLTYGCDGLHAAPAETGAAV